MKILSLDIETTGLDPWRDEIKMVGLYAENTYICCRTAEQLQFELETFSQYDLVCHNAPFDIKFLEVKGWWEQDGRVIHDTKILAHLVKDKVPAQFLEQYEVLRKEENKRLPHGISHREGSPLSLKVIAPWYLKVPAFWETPGNHDNEEYNEKDCRYTYDLFQLLAPRVKAEGSWDFYTKRMLEWSKMIMEMEIKGISISMEELDLVEKEYTEKRTKFKEKLDQLWMAAHHEYQFKQINDLEAKYLKMALVARVKAALTKVYADSNETKRERKLKAITERYLEMFREAIKSVEMKINYSSPKQMAWLLKEHLGLDIENAEGEESTGKAVLNKLSQDGREDVKTYLEWREADKVLTMYVPTYRELQVNGIIHPSFNLTGTRTGRTSSSGPNLQQVPPKLYRLFKPRSGYSFVQYDLSGIEAALIALYSGDQRLYEILEKGESIHDHNAKALFNLECSVAEVSSRYPKERKTVKNIGFACFYGAGWRRISQVFASGGFPITDVQAKEKLGLLKSYYPAAFAYHKEVTEIFESGETVHNLLGRPINIQKHENPYMQGFNTLIQSSASDINLLACERFWKDGFGASPLLVIHDCIMAEASYQSADLAAKRLEHHMTNFKLESVNGPIKLRVEGGVSDAWEK